MAEKGIRLWGVDAITVDHAHDKATHMLLRKLEFYHMENLANLDVLPLNVVFMLICVPLPFVGATASPLRPRLKHRWRVTLCFKDDMIEPDLDKSDISITKGGEAGEL